MSKIYDKYLMLKKMDSSKLYLFKSGNFYIFVGEDCDYINEYIVLKKTAFTKDVYKCGFPVNSLEQYMHVFNNHNLSIEVIDDYKKLEFNNNSSLDDLFCIIKNVDIDNITPLESLNLLSSLKERLNERC